MIIVDYPMIVIYPSPIEGSILNYSDYNGAIGDVYSVWIVLGTIWILGTIMVIDMVMMFHRSLSRDYQGL